MPSPFPGMDPYLEDPDEWPDVHGRLITYIADALQPRVLPTYRARINRREYVMRDDRTIYPDVAITERRLRETALELAAAVPALVAGSTAIPPLHEPLPPPPRSVDIPYRIRVPLVSQREPFLEIVHLDSREIVTAIELLSPANKRKGKGRDLYRRKQRDVLDSEASLVEIDLLGYGTHTVAVPEDRLAELPPHRYCVCVSRASDREVVELYAMTLADRLPRISIPLREPDADVVLDLPAVFTQCYDSGGYAGEIDYSRAPAVPLSEEEAAWVRGWAAGKVGVNSAENVDDDRYAVSRE